MAALRPSQLLHSSSSSLCVRAFTVARPQRHGRVLVSAEQQQEKAKGKPKNPLNTYRYVEGNTGRIGWLPEWLDRGGAGAAAAPACHRCLKLRLMPAPLRTLAACRPPSREGASLRAEAEAPFRSLRLFLFGAGVAGASLATLFGLPNLIGALGGAPNATKSVAEALQVCAAWRGWLELSAAGAAGSAAVCLCRRAVTQQAPCAWCLTCPWRVSPALQDFAINIGSLAACGYFVKGDLEVGAGSGMPAHNCVSRRPSEPQMQRRE